MYNQLENTRSTLKYKEGNNRPSSVNQISSVHNHDKAANKCYTKDNTDTKKNPKCENIGAAEELATPVVADHPPWNQQYNQSYPVGQVRGM